MKAHHLQWRKIWKKVRSSKSCTCKIVVLETSLEVSKLYTCFVYAVFCAMLCRFSTFLWRFNRFTPFLFLPFWKKTRLGTLDDLHRCWRRNMSTQSFTGGCVCDSTKRFPHCGIYTIHNCSLLP